MPGCLAFGALRHDCAHPLAQRQSDFFAQADSSLTARVPWPKPLKLLARIS